VQYSEDPNTILSLLDARALKFIYARQYKLMMLLKYPKVQCSEHYYIDVCDLPTMYVLSGVLSKMNLKNLLGIPTSTP